MRARPRAALAVAAALVGGRPMLARHAFLAIPARRSARAHLRWRARRAVSLSVALGWLATAASGGGDFPFRWL
jgi:hypothetical protein